MAAAVDGGPMPLRTAGKSVPAGMLHETFWFRAHGIEGLTYVEENQDPHQRHNQFSALPFRYRCYLESAALMQGVGFAADASHALGVESTGLARRIL